MIYRRKTYRILPEKYEEFNRFFHKYLLPNQKKHGARLVGRWVTENRDEIVAIWEYKDMRHYEEIEEKVRRDDLHLQAQQIRQELGELVIESSQDFMTATGSYHAPRQIVSVCGYITNDQGEVLLVRNGHRADTWELPGGQVEEFEALDQALVREIFEETGAQVALTGVTGIYQNVNGGIVNITFSGRYVAGELRCQEGETIEVGFKKLDERNVEAYITRPYLRSRFLDARKGAFVPLEIFRTNPYGLKLRLSQESPSCHG